MALDIKRCIFTKNECYIAAGKIKPAGIIVHSTGCNNPNLKRYVQPDDGILGKNPNGNDWNRPMKKSERKCVHGFIGKDKNGIVRFYQVLPFDYRCWGCGSGSKGSYNDGYIQFEICEDALKDEKYFNEAFKLAIEVCKYLMAKYDIQIKNVISHKEAAARGYASNHGDCDHWLAKFGKNMGWFRSQLAVKEKYEEATGEIKPVDDKDKLKPTNNSKSYKVKVTASALNVRAGAGTNYKKNMLIYKNEVYTIVETKGNWGKLKSGAGWICLDYTKKVN